MAACSTSDDVRGTAENDASPDAPNRVDGGADADSAPTGDAAVDLTRLHPLACAVPSCVVAISASEESYCVALADGHVVCWGANQDGNGAFNALPTAIPGISSAVDVERTCAVLSDGRLTCWNLSDTLTFTSADAGLPTRQPRVVPVPALTRVRIGRDVACGILKDGSATCWGPNFGLMAYAHDAGADPLSGAVYGPARVTIAEGRTVRDLAVSTNAGSGAIAVLTDDGRISTWGDETLLGRPSSLTFDPDPFGIEVGAPATAVGGGYLSTLATTVRGEAYIWGGIERNVLSAGPARVDVSELVVEITARNRACAVTRAGDVLCSAPRPSGLPGPFTKVAGLPEPAVHVAATPTSTCATTATGRVFCWGSDNLGQLGQGQRYQESATPVVVKIP